MTVYVGENTIIMARRGSRRGQRRDIQLEKLGPLQPYDIATNVLPGLTEAEQLETLCRLSPDRAAEVIEYLDYEHQYRLLDHLPEESAHAIINNMSSDSLVDLLGALHPRQASRLLEWLPQKERENVRQLMTYPENTAGGRATADYIAARQHWTAEQTMAHIRKVGREAELVYYIYVLDTAGRLVGVTSMRDVILAPPNEPLASFMKQNVISVPATMDQEEAGRVLAQYDFIALPVVNTDGRMIGIITHDDMIDVIQEEATEDVQRLGGTNPIEEPYLETPLPILFRKRVTWLLLLFITEALTSTVLRHYESQLASVIALAFFVPLIIGTGGNAGTQASTLVIRALAMGELTFRDLITVIWREIRLSLALGMALASAGLFRATLLKVPANVAAAVASAQLLVVIWASTVGATLPIMGKRLGADPAVFSSPLIATLTDAIGLIIYFEVARRILHI